ncbi:hypothetical protein [Terasakiella sp.]|uniref:hypothetical protein n=1 Tax=Terasakiella sp. TaxID=2034861 RepID=UPI003AA9761C
MYTNIDLLNNFEYVDFKSFIFNGTGSKIDQKHWNKKKQLRKEDKEHDNLIASKLSFAGIDPYQIDKREIAFIGTLTKSVERISVYRNSNIFRSVHRRNYSQMQKRLKAYMSAFPSNKQLYSWSIRWGWVHVSEYAEQHKAFKLRLRELLRSLKRWGLGAEFLRIEYPAIDGEHVNLHAHLIFQSHGLRKEWKDILSFAKNFMSRNDGNQNIQTQRVSNRFAAAAYLCKPNDLLKLSGNALAVLFKQLGEGGSALRFAEALGGFRKFSSELNKRGENIRETKGKYIRTKTKPKNIYKDYLASRVHGQHGSTDNVILGITPSRCVDSEIMEPCLIVKNYDGDFEKLLQQHPELSGLFSIKNKTTVTVPNKRKERLTKNVA